MRRIWEVFRIDVVHLQESPEEYNQTLDQWAEFVYCYICQLPDNQAEVPNFDALNEQERTVANG